MSSPTQAIEIYTPERRMAELEHRLKAVESRLATLEHTVKGQSDSLRLVFAEALRHLAAELDSSEPSATVSPKANMVWESWKQRVGGSAAKVIDALLLHSELNTQQLAIATGLHRTTIPTLIFKLNKAGLLNKNGGRFSLKQL